MAKLCGDIPPPEVPKRTIPVDELPLGARRIYMAARRAGWSAVTAYSRGPLLGAHGVPLRTASAVSIAMQRGDECLAALWFSTPSGSWVFQRGYQWRASGAFWPRWLDASELRAALAAPP